MITIDTPLIEIERPADADQIQRLYAAHGQRCIGLSCGRPETFRRFAELMGPGVSDAILHKPFGKGGISTCVLACRGQARYVGLAAPYVNKDWVPSRPGQDEEEWYRKQQTDAGRCAWVDARHCDPDLRPQVGHEVFIGCGGADEQYGGIQHDFRVLRWVDETTMETADGGSTDWSGLQCVGSWDKDAQIYKPSRKRWIVRSGQSWLVNPVTGLGRRVYGWAMPELCPHEGPCLAPEGWEDFE
jgi:hypothetical protein